MDLMKYIRHPSKIYLALASRGFFDWMSDELYLKLKFKMHMGKKLDLQEPETFNQKLQWLKLYDRKPEYTTMVDKYLVKDYVAGIIGEEYIIPTLGVWGKFDDIDFDQLPNQFVLKCTHDSGGLVICRDKSKLDKEKAKKKIEQSLKRNYFYSGREWPYKNVKPRIIAETYMEDEKTGTGLTDYKFFCFNGIPKMLYVSQGLEDHTTASISFYDMEGNDMPFHRSDYKPLEEKLRLPENYLEMTTVAGKLSQKVDAQFVRIDLYSIQGKVFFSEITFSPCSGLLPFEPAEWDKKIGQWIELPKKQK